MFSIPSTPAFKGAVIVSEECYNHKIKNAPHLKGIGTFKTGQRHTAIIIPPDKKHQEDRLVAALDAQGENYTHIVDNKETFGSKNHSQIGQIGDLVSRSGYFA